MPVALRPAGRGILSRTGLVPACAARPGPAAEFALRLLWAAVAAGTVAAARAAVTSGPVEEGVRSTAPR